MKIGLGNLRLSYKIIQVDDLIKKKFTVNIFTSRPQLFNKIGVDNSYIVKHNFSIKSSINISLQRSVIKRAFSNYRRSAFKQKSEGIFLRTACRQDYRYNLIE